MPVEAYISLAMRGQQRRRLWTLPASVLGHLGRPLGAGGCGSGGPAIAVGSAACAVGRTGATAKWRVLEKEASDVQSKLEMVQKKIGY